MARPSVARMVLAAVAAALVAALPGDASAARPRRAKPTVEGAVKRPAERRFRREAEPAPPPSSAPEKAPEGQPEERQALRPRGPTRIDFDDRLIQGQTNKSGAVYLFDRKELEVRSMVEQRTSFRRQIVQDVLAP